LLYVDGLKDGVAMSLEKFFRVKAGLFCLWFRLCCLFCMVFWALLARVLMALSMLACVTSNVAMRGDWLYWAALREEKFQKKKATDPLQTNLRIFSIITAPKFLAPT